MSGAIGCRKCKVFPWSTGTLVRVLPKGSPSGISYEHAWHSHPAKMRRSRFAALRTYALGPKTTRDQKVAS